MRICVDFLSAVEIGIVSVLCWFSISLVFARIGLQCPKARLELKFAVLELVESCDRFYCGPPSPSPRNLQAMDQNGGITSGTPSQVPPDCGANRFQTERHG